MREASEPLLTHDGVSLYTIKESSKYTGVSYHRIIYALARGWINPLQREPIVLIPEEELKRFVSERVSREN